jgi:hypothetical protein
LSLLNVENNSQLNVENGCQNIDLKLGFSEITFENTKWHFVELSKFEALKIGFNFNGNNDFLNFNLYKYESLKSTPDEMTIGFYTQNFWSKYLDILSINRDPVFKKQFVWFKLGLGYGYDLIKESKNFLILEVPIKLGYSNLKFNDNYADFAKNMEYEGIDFEIGPKIRYLSENLIITVESKFRKNLDTKDLNILENGIEITYSIKDHYNYGAHVEGGGAMGTAMVPYFWDILNISLFANYNIYSSMSHLITVPMIGVKFNIYGTVLYKR